MLNANLNKKNIRIFKMLYNLFAEFQGKSHFFSKANYYIIRFALKMHIHTLKSHAS